MLKMVTFKQFLNEGNEVKPFYTSDSFELTAKRARTGGVSNVTNMVSMFDEATSDNGRFEYVIWGIPQNGKYEELLVAKVENKAITSREDAERICDVLKVKHGATNTRIQVVDLGGGFGVNDFVGEAELRLIKI